MNDFSTQASEFLSPRVKPNSFNDLLDRFDMYVTIEDSELLLKNLANLRIQEMKNKISIRSKSEDLRPSRP